MPDFDILDTYFSHHEGYTIDFFRNREPHGTGQCYTGPCEMTDAGSAFVRSGDMHWAFDKDHNGDWPTEMGRLLVMLRNAYLSGRAAAK